MKPVFGNSTYKYSILETYSAGYVFGRINAYDPDNLGNITYTFEHNECEYFISFLLTLS